MLTIMLSHHRTGSTALRAELGKYIKVCPDEPLLFPLEVGHFDWKEYFAWATDRYMLVQFHREHVDKLFGWQAISESGCRIVHLTRLDRLKQALSYRRALRDNVWHGHPVGHSHNDAIALDELTDIMATWSRLEAASLLWTCGLEGLHVSYEEFLNNKFRTVERIVEFVTNANT